MGYKQDVAVFYLLHPKKLFLHLFPGEIIKSRKWLIHHDKVRLVGQCPGNGRPLLHTAGKLGRISFLKAGKSHGPNQSLNFFFILLRFFQAKHHIVPDCQPWHQPRLLKHKGRLVISFPQNFSGVSRLQAAGQPQKRSLAAAALPQNYRDLALRNVQINAI